MGIKTLLDKIIAWLAAKLHWMPSYDSLTDITLTTDPPEAPVSPVQPSNPPTMTNSQYLYQIAVQCLGKDMSPLDKAPDSLGCMESLDGVYTAAFGEHLLDPENRLSTHLGYLSMKKDPRLEAVSVPQAGDIVICPTGFSAKGEPHGHCGVWGNNDVMSNDSNSGLWTDNYTHEAWYQVFNKTLGFPVFFFRVSGVNN